MSLLNFNFLISSTCFETEGSSSGRRLYIQVWYSVFYMHQYKSLLAVLTNQCTQPSLG